MSDENHGHNQFILIFIYMIVQTFINQTTFINFKVISYDSKFILYDSVELIVCFKLPILVSLTPINLYTTMIFMS